MGICILLLFDIIRTVHTQNTKYIGLCIVVYNLNANSIVCYVYADSIIDIIPIC